MNKWHRSLFWQPLSTALTFLSLSTHVWAQTSTPSEESLLEEYFSDWYQVEVIIFERQQSSEEDVWPKNIALAYPPKLQRLHNPRLDAEATDLNTVDQTPSLRDAPLDPDTSSKEALLATINNSEQIDQLNRKLIETMADAEQAEESHKERPFVLLEASERELNDEARAINRTQRLRVVFHETWRQPMTAPEHAQAIIIQGGKSYDTHTELEGSIILGVKRYLHIQTNLWMTEFEANYGQTPEHWPALPELPNMIQARGLTTELSLNTHLLSTEDNAENINSNLSSGNWQPQIRSDRFNFGDVAAPNKLQNFNAYTENPYIIRHVTQMQQTRRMRSKELHYIDHPRMGLLVKIIKYTPTLSAEKT